MLYLQRIANTKESTVTAMKRTTERLSKELAGEREAGASERAEAQRVRREYDDILQRVRRKAVHLVTIWGGVPCWPPC